MFKTGKSIFEDVHRVKKFRRLLEPDDPTTQAARGSNPSERSRKQRLLQFYAVNGGLRTIAVDDIVDVK